MRRLRTAQAPAWQPDLAAAVSYASHRHGTVAFAVRTEGGAWGWHANRVFPSASVLKAMLLVAYLDLPSVRGRRLGPADRALLAPMIGAPTTPPQGACSGASVLPACEGSPTAPACGTSRR